MEQAMAKRVAVFDVDGTLLRGDCLWLAARRSKGVTGQMLAGIEVLPWLFGWKLRLVSTGRFKQQIIAAFGICEAVNRANAAGHEDWLLGELRVLLRTEALHRLRWHQQRGDRLLLCSASPRLLLQPLADWLGVELLCTEMEQNDGRWLPKLSSANCKGPEKVKRLEQQIGPLDALMIEAYGDSRGDMELLQSAVLPHYRSFLSNPKPYPAFSLWPLLLVVALALFGYGLLGIWSQGDQLIPLLRTLWPQIVLGLLLVLVAFGIRYVRWRLLLAALKQYPDILVDARIWMGSFAFTATPGKSGEAVRSILLRQECGVPVPPTLMALVVERLTDGTAVLLLLLINLPLLLRWQFQLAVPIAIAGISVFAGWQLLRSCWAKAQLKIIAKRLLPRKFAFAGGEGLVALRKLLKPALFVQATLIGSLAWSLEGMSLWLVLRGMGIDAVGIGGATVAHTVACLIGILSLLPGGLGSSEAGTVGLLALQGVPVATSTLAALMIRLMTLWFATAIGVACLLWPASRNP
jgi:HAD superfamily phosphoserine phosphatase-like hydrolase